MQVFVNRWIGCKEGVQGFWFAATRFVRARAWWANCPLHFKLSWCSAWLTLLAVCSGASAQTLNSGMVDIAAAVGIAETTHAYHVSVADYNRDGWPDFLFNRGWSKSMRLYRNTRNKDGTRGFQEDTATNFGITDRLNCQWGDPNVDGRPDLYCSVGANFGTAVKANQLWIQQADGTFKEQAAAWGVTDPYGRGRQVTFFNLNGDKFPDLFVGNEYPRVDGIPSPNRVFVNVFKDGRRQFEERIIPGVTAEIGAAACAFAADVDNDGDDDLFVCGNNGLRIYRNDFRKNKTFVDMAPGLKLSAYHTDVVAADVNGDGKRDLILATPNNVSIWLQTGSWTFRRLQVISWISIRGLAVADVDGDRDLDVYVLRSQGVSGIGGAKKKPADLLLRNRGNGTFTAQIAGSWSTPGIGGRCAAIDHDRDGRAGILVVNSYDTLPQGTRSGPIDWGPLQLMIQP